MICHEHRARLDPPAAVPTTDSLDRGDGGPAPSPLPVNYVYSRTSNRHLCWTSKSARADCRGLAHAAGRPGSVLARIMFSRPNTEAGIEHQRHGTPARGIVPVDARRDRTAGLRERQPRRDPGQHRPPDSAAVRDRRLLGLPAGARSRQPGAGGDRRPAAGERRPRPHAPGEGLAGLVAEQVRPEFVAEATRIRASSTFPRPARIRIARSSACRSSTAACCRACSSSRPSRRARSTPRTCGC